MQTKSGITPQAYVGYLMGMLGVNYTEEQKNIIYNFNDSMIVWADPGTGKTQTSVAGLLCAEQIYSIPAKNIVAMSFTREATAELRLRHSATCKKIGIKSNVVFKTIHALARKILVDHASKIGIKKLEIVESLSLADSIRNVETVARDFNIELSQKNVRGIAKAIESLNSSLVFDREHVESKYAFKSADVYFEIFNFFRRRDYFKKKKFGKIPRGETCLYALEILEKNPEISEAYKNSIDLMLIDEAQDMSMLQLKFLSLLCKKLIIIGDIKQQIFAFQGACAEILPEYQKLYPESKEFLLTRSFRCGRKIAEFATTIIKRNKMGGENFTGRDKNESVEITSELSLSDLIQKVKDDLVAERGVFPYEIAFLYRNNFSSIPVIQALYDKKIPAVIPKYIDITSLPVVSDLLALINLASNPYETANVNIVYKLLPEFEQYLYKKDSPLVKVMDETGLPFTGINYKYYNAQDGYELLSVLNKVRDSLQTLVVSDLCNILWPFYARVYLKRKAYTLDQDPKYYFAQAAPVLKRYTYKVLNAVESDKQRFFAESTESNKGVHLYTFHSAKGTEADYVYLLDTNEGLIPNNKKLKQYIAADCHLEAAITLRNERSLLYVAATRARSKLVVQYTEQLAELVMGTSSFDNLDSVYFENHKEYDDVTAFLLHSAGDLSDVKCPIN